VDENRRGASERSSKLSQLNSNNSQNNSRANPNRAKSAAIPQQDNSDTDYARKNFSAAKSISSSQYYGEEKEDVADKEQRLSRFSNSRAISSADYYERDESDMNKNDIYGILDMNAGDLARKLADHATSDIGSIKDSLSVQGRRIGNVASTFFQDLQEKYNASTY